MTEPGESTEKLIVDRATKFYDTRSGPLHALDGYSMAVNDGEFVCVVGPSGCGKTTLLWSMAGLHGLTGGQVLLDGARVQGPHPEIGMVFQEANLLPWRTLARNIRLPFEIKGTRPDRAWIDHLLERVGLDGFGGKYPRELSGGMQQRASIVRALSFNPSVLMMDEPFGALDAFTRDEMNLMVEEIWLETRKTIVFITHNIAEAVFLSDRVYVMSARPGRLRAVHEIDIDRPRRLEITTEPGFFEKVNAIKAEIEHHSERTTGRRARGAAPMPEPRSPAHG